MTRKTNNRADVYTRVTDKIIAEPENGGRLWMKPWNVEHAAGRISKPLRFNGQAYNGINVLMLWPAAMEKDYAAPIWMTFRKPADSLLRHAAGPYIGSIAALATRSDLCPLTIQYRT